MEQEMDGEMTEPSMNVLKIRRSWQRRLARWARRQKQAEICGALVGRGGRVTRILPARNVAHEPDSFYMDPRDLLSIFLYVERTGLDLLAFYHSHPRGPGTPSDRDLAEARYPEQLMVIIHPDHRKRPMRAFAVTGTMRELPVRRPASRGQK